MGFESAAFFCNLQKLEGKLVQWSGRKKNADLFSAFKEKA